MAFMVCSQYTRSKGQKPLSPSEVLCWMVAEWLRGAEVPSAEQSTEQQVAMARALTKQHGGKINGVR